VIGRAVSNSGRLSPSAPLPPSDGREESRWGIVASQLYAHAFPRQVQDAAITLNAAPGSRSLGRCPMLETG